MESVERVKSLIAHEPPEILRPLIVTMHLEVERLRGVIKEIEAENARKAQLQLNIDEQLKQLRRKIFARSKEDRLDKESLDKKRESQEDVALFAQAVFPAPAEAKTQKGKWASVPEREIPHSMSAEELTQESIIRGLENPSADQWEEVANAFDRVKTIEIIDRSYEIQVHLKKKYKLKEEFNPDPDEKTVFLFSNMKTKIPRRRVLVKEAITSSPSFETLIPIGSTFIAKRTFLRTVRFKWRLL
jgi:hypothetical protein